MRIALWLPWKGEENRYIMREVIYSTGINVLIARKQITEYNNTTVSLHLWS